jgi:nanoRNase/pAp phosphatase (c-di-AMP/oligoRNAs hydrolase)
MHSADWSRLPYDINSSAPSLAGGGGGAGAGGACFPISEVQTRNNTNIRKPN